MKNYYSKFIGYLFFACIILIDVPGTGGPSTNVDEALLDITPQGQQNDAWCWAASISMVAGFLVDSTQVVDISQCHLATRKRDYQETLGALYSCGEIRNCCNLSTEGGCIYKDSSACSTCTAGLMPRKDTTFASWNPIVDEINFLLSEYGLIATNLGDSTDVLGRIKYNLKHGNPVLGIYGITGGTHVVVIRGFVTNEDSDSYLLINNPLKNKVADCMACFHAIQTREDGSNFLTDLNGENTYRHGGRYTNKLFLSVARK